jgi:hypothetical protein
MRASDPFYAAKIVGSRTLKRTKPAVDRGTITDDTLGSALAVFVGSQQTANGADPLRLAPGSEPRHDHCSDFVGGM